MQFQSEWQHVNAPIADVYAFVTDLNKLEQLMPDQVINWKADADRCSFTIQGMADLQLRVDERLPNQSMRLVPVGKAPFPFSLEVELKPEAASCKAKVQLIAALNPMLAMMASRPLQNLVNIMAQKLAEVNFKNQH